MIRKVLTALFNRQQQQKDDLASSTHDEKLKAAWKRVDYYERKIAERKAEASGNANA